MKVKDLLEALAKMDPESHLCAIVYAKESFDYPADDEVELTDAGWEEVCRQFDESQFDDVWESILMAVSELAVDK